MKRFRTIFLMFIATIHAIACGFSPPTESPIPKIEFINEPSPNSTLVIMLPGRGDRAETFAREGFENAGKQHGFDTILVDAHFGYYMRRSLIPALHDDIVIPARAAGYEKIWLLGVSMGGFGSLLYSAEHPDQVDGLVLLAPFLGDDDVIDEISQAGGLDQWNPEESGLKDYEIAVWSWLKNTTSSKNPTPILLGYGNSDRLASAYPLLTGVMDPEDIYSIDGEHNWTTWKVLWEEISVQIDAPDGVSLDPRR